MKALSSNELLDLWERGKSCHTVDRSVLLLAAALPAKPAHSLPDVSVGERDMAILDLRSAMMGPNAQAVIDCPSCGERLEFSFDSRSFRLSDTSHSNLSSVIVNGWTFRIPNTLDVARIAHEQDVERAAIALLKECWITDSSGEEPQWSEELLQAVEARMEEMDPQGDLNLDFDCERCGHTWQCTFDVTGFFWDEIEVCAKRLLEEVHVLATAYGWTEPAVLALSDARRAAYIDMVTS